MAEFDLPIPHRETAGGQQLAEKLFRVRVRGFVSRDVMETYPDTYRLDSLDDKTVRFTLISHYDRNWDILH